MNQPNTEVRRKVVGAVGLNGSGKDALIQYLGGRCGLTVLSLGDVARELAHLEEVPSSRDNLHEVSQKYIDKYGEDFFVKVLIKEIDNKLLEKVGIIGSRALTPFPSIRTASSKSKKSWPRRKENELKRINLRGGWGPRPLAPPPKT